MLLSLIALLPVIVLGASIPSHQYKRDGTTSNVYFDTNTGSPQHLASGMLYGIPDTPNQIPSDLITGMGFNYLRAGGAQLPAPARGWIWGLTEYKNRFESVLSNYQTAQQYGADFIFLIHDLYGCDGSQNSSTPYPGDNGDWSYFDAYFDQLVSDMKANNMLGNIIIDIWNEPNGSNFWNRPQSQYLQYFCYAYNKFREVFGEQVLLSGPSFSYVPTEDNTWEPWAQYVSENSCIPDQYSWHMGGGSNVQLAASTLDTIRAKYNLPSRPYIVNEYGLDYEEQPAGSAWYISQFERSDIHGLRSNWASSYELHDFMAWLVSKPGAPNTYSSTGTGYYPNGDWQVYNYYVEKMTGYRVATTPSSDVQLDTYATVDTNAKVARVLCGVMTATGTWYVQLNNLTSLGLPETGTLQIHTYAFQENNGVWGEVDAPQDDGLYGHPYSNGQVSFPIFQNDETTAYAFEFTLP